MLSSAQIELFKQLQNKSLSTSDPSTLVDILLTEIFNKSPSVELSYVFISGIFINPDSTLKNSLFLDEYTVVKKGVIAAPNLLNIKGLVDSLGGSEVILIENLKDLINPTYYNTLKVKSLIASPLKVAGLLIGVLVFGSPKVVTEISEGEKEFLVLVNHLMAQSYRLEDTQNSLTNISQEVYKMNAKLHELDHLKDDFVSVASHELRTPMTAIRSYVWMALNRPDMSLTEKMKKYLTRTLISTERLINLVNDMLNVSRIESGRIDISPKPFDIIALAKDVGEEVKPKADEKQVQVLVNEDRLPQVFGDPDKIRQVLLNLIGNSLKFTPASGSISASFKVNGDMIEVYITDTGQGLSGEDLGRLFKKFGRLDSSYVAMGTSGGTGLGLYISKSLVELMKGKMWATSEGIGKGSTFAFSLPIVTEAVLKEAEKYTTKATGEAKPLEPVAI